MSATPTLQWLPEGVERLLRRHGINNRNELAERLQATGVTSSVIYRSFDECWAGKASAHVLAVLAHTFAVPLAALVAEPSDKGAKK